MKTFGRITGGLLALVLVFGVFAYEIPSAQAATDIFTTSGTWTAPAGITSANIDAWAGGGGGGRGTGGGNTGDGGGAGAYSGGTVTVIPGNVYTVSVGKAGVGGIVGTPEATAGGDSMFNSSTTILAKGGTGGKLTGSGAGTGGSSASGFGTNKFSGGNGGVGDGAIFGGGGGGGAGTTGNGGAASGSTAGTGTSVGGGNGGFHESTGSVKGGGGGGANSGDNGAAGARGEVDVTYTATPATSSAPSTLTIKSKTIIRGQFIFK